MVNIKILRSFLGITITMLALVLSGCGNKPLTTNSATRLYNHWLGYCYIVAGQIIDSRFALTGAIINSPSAIKGNNGIEIQGFFINGQSSDPWRTLELDWSLNRVGRNNFLPLKVKVSSGGQRTNLKLGNWYIEVMKKQNTYPLQVKRQSVGEVLAEMPVEYPFSIKLSNRGLDVPKNLSIITNADSNVVKIIANKLEISGKEVNLKGVISFLDRSNQIYLIPALSYTYGKITYTQPLLPMVFAVFPSSQTQSFSDEYTKF